MLPTLNLSYAMWKALRTDLSDTTYYVQEDNRYIPFLVDLTRKFVYRTDVSRIDNTNANLIDFEANVKSTATVELSIEDGIAARIIL